jgi:hypothetical protein
VLHVARLHLPPALAQADDEHRRAVHAAVDPLRVDHAGPPAGHREERPHDRRVIELVDPELVAHQPVDAAQPLADASRQLGPGQVGEPGERQAAHGDGDRERQHGERRVRPVMMAHHRLDGPGDRQPAADRREHGQHDERSGHQRRRLV